MSTSILIVDPEKKQAQLLADILVSANFGYQCQMVHSLEDVKYAVKEMQFDVMLVDHKLPDERLYPKLQQIKLKNRALRIIMLAEEEIEPKELAKAREYYIEGFCAKSNDYPNLINVIEQVIE